MRFSGPVLATVLNRRAARGKEDVSRLDERRGMAKIPRPGGSLVWIHAASVGEAQSALILIDKIAAFALHTSILVTTGTVTSASIMAQRLPANAIHQYIPLDHPEWCARFLDHWKPDIGIWLESELWPNLLLATSERNIPAILVNARLSDASFRNWTMFKGFAADIVGCFDLIVTQTNKDAARFKSLDAKTVITGGNIKFSAAPLPIDELSYAALRLTVGNRPLWVYASTHAGEEEIACRVHSSLKTKLPDLLTIIVPRHAIRGPEIKSICEANGLACGLRSENAALPRIDDDIYIADTMGELGLFYNLCPVAVIGRSFSNDGGGGHNPIEAAQFGCAILTGPHNQYQREIYDDMAASGAVIEAATPEILEKNLLSILTDPEKQTILSEKSLAFANNKTHVANDVFQHLIPYLEGMKEGKHAA